MGSVCCAELLTWQWDSQLERRCHNRNAAFSRAIRVTFGHDSNQMFRNSVKTIEQDVLNASSNTLAPTRTGEDFPAPEPGAIACLRHHWPEYLMEAGLLGTFMISACIFAIVYGHPGSPVRHAIPSTFLRGLLGGISMGMTALVILYSPWAKQSGGHINPAVTLTFLRLRKVRGWDAFFYIAAQAWGAIGGVSLAALMFRTELSHPAVRFAVTTPGPRGPWVAFLAEFLMATGMMSAVLYFSNHQVLSRYTGVFASTLVAIYITVAAPLSGMSMNPARSFGSALPSGIWNDFWIYLMAPPLGMLMASELYLWRKSAAAVKCCKLHHDNHKRCIFCGANGGFKTT